MNDPFGRASQALTDALLHLDQSISLAEANVAAARQIGLPEAADLAARLPGLTIRAREFLASIPTAAQTPRWGENRRLLEQAHAFQPLFAPYIMLGNRVTIAKQAIADRAAREKAAADEAQRAFQMYECNAALETVRRRYSAGRQAVADMQLQRGPGFDDAAWHNAVRSILSILGAQDVRIASATASIRDSAFDEARAMLDQSLGELQAALDLVQRARAAADVRARSLTQPAVSSTAVKLRGPAGDQSTQPIAVPIDRTAAPDAAGAGAQSKSTVRGLLLIEARTGTIFRCDGTPTVIGRGLDATSGQPYLNLSQACYPGEAEDLGISRRHAELARQADGLFAIRDLDSTNGTRLKRAADRSWLTLQPHQWTVVGEGDTLQFGLLECVVSLAR